ncbi:restriction endonuclease fold toxin 5 of polymorphic toxin system [Paraburkholderia caballeronis]|uniref:restriction endonuclease fold toxin 5 domain-containing protein n=1 Tax=Paraburkholderia caballeronis TaxID=416943 RepID=UPI0010648E24|nr:restriction endonuclease fold toxin 5 domain-containing protein [Paraburkholderia caballeronis]TDV25359.1 restriction endonuclease fold toxin 5 of polymorphic toxin system [Paraburkholderia caballeronis]
MVALAIPLLEGAGAAITAAWTAFVSSGTATAVAGGAATAAVLSLPGDTAQEKDKAKVDTGTLTRTQKPQCKCPPDRGHLVTRNWDMSEISREYQAFVTGFQSGTEWAFSGRDFDGFRKSHCQLEEAKARYDQFFDPITGQPKWFFAIFGAKKIQAQAVAQNIVVLANQPTRLRWYFMQPLSFRYFTRMFRATAPLAVTELKPLNQAVSSR